MSTFDQVHYQNFVQQYQFMAGLSNVKLNFKAVDSANTHPLEQVYLHHIFKELSSFANFDNYQFYVIGSNSSWDFPLDERSIVFYMSNEDHHIPESLSSCLAVFTPYCPVNKQSRPANVFPIPLGYNGAIQMQNPTPVHERQTDVFFSGNLHKKRWMFYAAVQKMNFFHRMKGVQYQKEIHFSSKFTGGLPPEVYAKTLLDSKIALVPSGYISLNSFRFFEAARYGAIVITPKLYDYWFYKEFPGIQVNSWWGLQAKLQALLDHPDRLLEKQGQMLDYYEKYCSEKAVANYIVEKIEQIQSLK